MRVRAPLPIFLLAIFGAIGLHNLSDMDQIDYQRTPAASAPDSRWYSLQELRLSVRNIQDALREGRAQNTSSDLYNILDLRDRACFPSLRLRWERRTISNTEAWEDGIGPLKDVVGYPSVVRNTRGRNPDGKYYLFYAIHDPYSGIGAASASNLDGPWQKVGPQASQADSRVMRAPRRPRMTSHFSSPVVIWNESEQLWFMYFHFYSNEWQEGRGHQRTALATSPDLASRDWKPWADSEGRLIAVLPVTKERWMNSQSTYHAVYKLPGDVWLAFLRGEGGEYAGSEWKQDPAALGIAVSRDGRHWAQLPGNPLIHQRDGHDGRAGVYRPQFVAMLRDRYFFAWAESQFYDAAPILVTAESMDLRQFKLSPVDFGNWTPADGAVPVIRASDTLYLFSGSRERAYEMLERCAATPADATQEK
jgi:hypothetical protein